jgi:hypothetical protein
LPQVFTQKPTPALVAGVSTHSSTTNQQQDQPTIGLSIPFYKKNKNASFSCFEMKKIDIITNL